MNNEPVAWMDEETGCFVYSQYDYEDLDEHGKDGLIPLYTHPVKELPTKEDEYWLMVEVLRAKVKEQQAEIGALRMMLANRNDALDRLDLKSTPCKYTEGM